MKIPCLTPASCSLPAVEFGSQDPNPSWNESIALAFPKKFEGQDLVNSLAGRSNQVLPGGVPDEDYKESVALDNVAGAWAEAWRSYGSMLCCGTTTREVLSEEWLTESAAKPFTSHRG